MIVVGSLLALIALGALAAGGDRKSVV